MIATPPSSDPGSPSPPQSPEKPKGNLSRLPSAAGTGGESKKERKLGHRRVTEEGTVTYKKKTTSEIQRALQLGIHHQINHVQKEQMRDVLLRDFMTMETVSFPSAGSRTTPAHGLSDFKFRTYAPIAFRTFRARYKLDITDFLRSLCGEELRELSNPGASGSIFYITQDDEFIIKTVQRREGNFLQNLLPHYFINLMQHYRTLLPKFYGYYCYQTASKNIRFIIMNNLMPTSVRMHEKYDLKGSLYKRKASAKELAKTSPTLKDLDFREKHPEGILLEAETYDALRLAIEQDCRVLESLKIMDYSLLLCVHNLDEAKRERLQETKKGSLDDAINQTLHGTASGGDDIARPSGNHVPLGHTSGLPINGASSSSSLARMVTVVNQESSPSGSRDPSILQPALAPSIINSTPRQTGKVAFLPLPGADGESCGISVQPPGDTATPGNQQSSSHVTLPSVGPATTALQRGVRKEKSKKRITAYCTAMESIAANAQPVDLEQEELDLIPSGGIFARSSNGERLLLFLGIIDILQSYRFSKKLEHGFKAIAIDGKTISVTPPSFYSRRFQDSLFQRFFKRVPNPMKQHAANAPGRRLFASPSHSQNAHYSTEGGAY